MKLSFFFCLLLFVSAESDDSDNNGKKSSSKVSSSKTNSASNPTKSKPSKPKPQTNPQPNFPNPQINPQPNFPPSQSPNPPNDFNTPTLQDFQKLYLALSNNFVNSRNIPKLVRMSFHDLLNFDSSTGSTGAQGCILDSRTVASFGQNNGLSSFGRALKSFVRNEFPTLRFSSGDIVSLAGKVAVEKAFPCIKIKWSFGRRPCTGRESQGGPGPNIDSLSQMKPFLRRYGLSAIEMATLTVGAHGVAGSVNSQRETGIASFRFARVSSGVEFIRSTINTRFRNFGTWYGAASSPSSLGRLPSDMMFFPTTLRKIGGTIVDRSSEIARVEATLIRYTESSFNKAFGDVFAKMLLIGTQGTNLTPFSEGSTTC